MTYKVYSNSKEGEIFHAGYDKKLDTIYGKNKAFEFAKQTAKFVKGWIVNDETEEIIYSAEKKK